jgi:hypothetical protein
LAHHERTVHSPAQFSCDICVERNDQAATNTILSGSTFIVAVFTTYGELQAHIRSEHPPTCPYCSEPFDTTNELTVHIDLFHNAGSSRHHDSEVQDGERPAKKARKDRGMRRAPAITKNTAPKVNPLPFGLGDSSAANSAVSSAAHSPQPNSVGSQDFRFLDSSMTMFGDSFWGASGNELSFDADQGYVPAAPLATRRQTPFALPGNPEVALPQMRFNSDNYIPETSANSAAPARVQQPMAPLETFIDPLLFTAEAERETSQIGKEKTRQTE